jgi:hypothetical protein
MDVAPLVQGHEGPASRSSHPGREERFRVFDQDTRSRYCATAPVRILSRHGFCPAEGRHLPVDDAGRARTAAAGAGRGCGGDRLVSGERTERVDAFIPVYETALITFDLITAVLLFGQFAFLRSRAILVLASGYLFTSTMTLAHALSFPGLFSPQGLLGAGPQTTV